MLSLPPDHGHCEQRSGGKEISILCRLVGWYSFLLIQSAKGLPIYYRVFRHGYVIEKAVTVNTQSYMPSKSFCVGNKNFPRVKLGE